MKKFFLCGLLIMWLILTACGGTGKDSPQGDAPASSGPSPVTSAQEDEQAAEELKTALLSKAIQLDRMILRMSQSEDYVHMMSYSSEINELVGEMGKGHGQPSAAFFIQFPKDGEPSFYNWMMSDDQDFSSLDPVLKEDLERRFFSGVASYTNALTGDASTVAACALLNTNDSFLLEGLEAPAMVLLTFDSDYQTLVTCLPCEDGVISAIASPILLPEGTQAETEITLEQVELWANTIQTGNSCVQYSQEALDGFLVG